MTDPLWVDTESKKLQELAKKHKMSFKAVDARPNTSYTTVFKRSGYSYSKRLHSLVVSNNAVRSAVLDGEDMHKKRHSGGLESATSSRASIQASLGGTGGFAKSKGSQRPGSGHVRFELTGPQAFLTRPPESGGVSQQTISRPGTGVSSQSQKTVMTGVSCDSAQTIRTIRKMLHPFIPEDFCTDTQAVTLPALISLG